MNKITVDRPSERERIRTSVALPHSPLRRESRLCEIATVRMRNDSQALQTISHQCVLNLANSRLQPFEWLKPFETDLRTSQTKRSLKDFPFITGIRQTNLKVNDLPPVVRGHETAHKSQWDSHQSLLGKFSKLNKRSVCTADEAPCQWCTGDFCFKTEICRQIAS